MCCFFSENELLIEMVTGRLQSGTLEIQFPKLLINQSIYCHCDPRTVQTCRSRLHWDFPGGAMHNLSANTGDLGSISDLGQSHMVLSN